MLFFFLLHLCLYRSQSLCFYLLRILFVYVYKCYFNRGMDPIFMTVLASTGSGIVGYLFGGSICSSLWRSRYKELNQVSAP